MRSCAESEDTPLHTCSLLALFTPSTTTIATYSSLRCLVIMSVFRNIDVRSPNIQSLQSTIQLELARRSYSPEDDPVMAEYIVVMLANQKTPEQITAEMKDLIGSEYEENFTEWVWAETQRCLDQHAPPEEQEGASAIASTSAAPGPSITRTRNARQRRSRSPLPTNGRSQERRRSRSPTFTDARRDERRRSRSPSAARTSTSPVYRRGPPFPRDYSSNEAFQESLKRRPSEEPFDGRSFWRQKAEERRRNPPPPVAREGGPRQLFGSAIGRATRNGNGNGRNAERELFPTSSDPASRMETPPPRYEEAGISIFGRAGVPDPRAPEFVPSSYALQAQSVDDQIGSAATPSILARIDPMLPNNAPLPAATTQPDPATTHSSDFSSAPTETSLCRWNVGCTNPMCPYSHASPANVGPGGDPNALVLSQQNCRYGARCTNKDCTRSHVSPAVSIIQARTQPQATNFAPSPAPTPAVASTSTVLSMDTALPNGTGSRPCRFGASCTRADCFFSHPPGRVLPGSAAGASATPCRFGLGCTRADCFFSHPPGQRASGVGGTVNRLQVFAQGNGGEDEEMEVIIPGGTSVTASSTIASSPQTAPVSLST